MTPEATTIVLATNNPDKVREIRPMLTQLGAATNVFSLQDLSIDVEIEETEDTLEGNARLKAKAIMELLPDKLQHSIVLADDTGLEVDALGGAPGVYSARFAPMPEGRTPTYEDNVAHLLHVMEGRKDRSATFRTVIAIMGMTDLAKHDKAIEMFAEGRVPGTITTEKEGNGGFGYDPVFRLDSHGKTYAEIGSEEKNRVSHRALALQNAVRILKELTS